MVHNQLVLNLFPYIKEKEIYSKDKIYKELKEVIKYVKTFYKNNSKYYIDGFAGPKLYAVGGPFIEIFEVNKKPVNVEGKMCKDICKDDSEFLVKYEDYLHQQKQIRIHNIQAKLIRKIKEWNKCQK